MKRSGRLNRRTRLQSKTELRRRTALHSNRKARLVARDRAEGWCEARIDGVCLGRGSHAHHVLPRSAGGTDTPENLLWVCSADHQWIHEHPAAAYEAGWLRRRSA